MSIEFDTYCGLSCKNCEYREKTNCSGCIASKGDPFHGEWKCEIAACAQSKNRRFCGECADFPCDTLKKYSNDPEHGDHGARIENCIHIKKALVAEGREGLDPLAVCGFNCNHCFMGEWCGGCRSNYNCCSYGTLFEGNVCPNVSCAKEKNIEGCYECKDLDDCKKGYYSVENEYLAKASALFIREYGKEQSEKAFLNANKNSKQTGETLEKATSVEAAFNLLKKNL